MITGFALVDLIAILPFWKRIGGSDAFLLRAIRLLRVLKLAKLRPISSALQELGNAIKSRRYELSVTFGFASFILLAPAAVMYFVERSVQLEAFGGILRSLWWAIATFTTVSYGDIYPVTALGKMFAGISSLAAIGLIAMPTGIMAAAFSEAFKKIIGNYDSAASTRRREYPRPRCFPSRRHRLPRARGGGRSGS